VSGAVVIEGRIEAVEHLGADTIVELSTAGPPLTAKVTRNDSLRYDETIRMWVDPDKALVFDAESGKRLRA
jgi:ABC-type sugar transport system ATPase subunit